MLVYKNREFRLLRWFSLGLLALAVLLLLIAPVVRIGFKFEIGYNEGWNLSHVLKAASGQPLYDDQNEWTPLDYPPFSFYFVSIIGRLLGDPLLTGRIIAFLSLLLVSLGTGYAVRILGGEVYHNVFSSIFCLGLFVVCAPHYVGLNDPQMLGHVFIVGGLLVYLQNRSKGSKMLIVALFFSVGLFVKLNLVLIPIAVTIDIFLRSRRNFFKWIGYLAFIMGSFIFIIYMIYGSEFLHQLILSTSKTYSVRKAIDRAVELGTKMKIPLIMVLPCVLHAFRKKHFRFVSVYLAISIPVGIYTSAGSGSDVNMFFDLFISLSIAAGMLLLFLKKSCFNANLICSILPIVLGLSILTAAWQKIEREEIFPYSEFKLKQQIFLDDAAFLATRPGPVLCENLLLGCYSNKSFEYDPYNTSQMMLTGRIDESKILNRLESGYFSVVQLNKPLDDRYLKELTYTSVQRSVFERFTENFKRSLGKYYILIRKTGTGAFYVPKITTE
jgi:hypothetical protein